MPAPVYDIYDRCLLKRRREDSKLDKDNGKDDNKGKDKDNNADDDRNIKLRGPLAQLLVDNDF